MKNFLAVQAISRIAFKSKTSGKQSCSDAKSGTAAGRTIPRAGRHRSVAQGNPPHTQGATLCLSALLISLAQATPFAPIEQFLLLLGMLCLAIGVCLLAFGGYQISTGRVTEGLLSVLGGFILAVAVPLMKWLHGMW